MDLSAALSSIATAIGIAKELNDINTEFDKATLKLKIAELTSSLADVKIQMANASSDVAGLEAEISKLRDQFKYRAEKTIRSQGHTYEADEDGKPIGAPFCPTCEQEGKLIRVVSNPGPGRLRLCPKCKGLSDAHIYGWPDTT